MNFNQVIDAIKANYQVIGAIVGSITFIGYIFNIHQKVSKLEQAKEIYAEKLKILELKYDTFEKVKKIEYDIERLNIENKAEKEYVKEHVYNIINILSDRSNSIDARCERLESRIESTEYEMNAHKEVHPSAHKSSAD